MEAVRERQPLDRQLFGIVLFLLVIGTVAVLDASFARAMQSKANNFDQYFFFKRQAINVAAATVVLIITMNTPYWWLRDWRFWVGGILVTLVLLVVVLIPGIGISSGGARRWLGFGPLRFQPSELAKVTLVLFLARYSDMWRSRIEHLGKGLLPAVVVIFVIGGLVAKEDLGTAITIMGTGLLMVVMMGARVRHLAGLGVLAMAGGVALIAIEPYRIDRIKGWLDLIVNPFGHHSSDAYQPAQGLIALGSGGFWGRGVMLGTAKHLYLPAEHTDYIFATLGEELGLVGCLAILAIFGWLVVRGLTIAHRTRDWFGSLLAAGLTCTVGVQVVLNIAVVSGLLPCTGVPLPFISYGGSSVLFTAAAMGIVLNISQYPNPSVAESAGRSYSEDRPDGWRHRRAHLSGA